MNALGSDSPLEQSPLGDGPDLDQADIEELTETTPDAYQVVYSGQDFDVEGLVRRFDRGDILIPQFGHNDERIKAAGFQRNFVWTKPQMDRFIESLLLGYPIPSILLVRQPDKRYLVLDGQQRMRTLQTFYGGIYQGRVFTLSNVSDKFKGLSYATLDEDERRAVDNTYIQATIVDTDGSVDSLEAIYQIFERLNSGGTQLTAHEIRVALYAGPFIDLLSKLNECDSWRNLYGPTSPRLRDQELILRIIALACEENSYERPLKRFLNSFVAKNREADSHQIKQISHKFQKTSDLLMDAVGPDALRRKSRQVNVAQADAVFVAMMEEMDKRQLTEAQVRDAVSAIRTDEEMDAVATSGTSTEDSVHTRLRKAREWFGASNDVE